MDLGEGLSVVNAKRAAFNTSSNDLMLLYSIPVLYSWSSLITNSNTQTTISRLNARSCLLCFRHPNTMDLHLKSFFVQFTSTVFLVQGFFTGFYVPSFTGSSLLASTMLMGSAHLHQNVVWSVAHKGSVIIQFS